MAENRFMKIKTPKQADRNFSPKDRAKRRTPRKSRNFADLVDQRHKTPNKKAVNKRALGQNNTLEQKQRSQLEQTEKQLSGLTRDATAQDPIAKTKEKQSTEISEHTNTLNMDEERLSNRSHGESTAEIDVRFSGGSIQNQPISSMTKVATPPVSRTDINTMVTAIQVEQSNKPVVFLDVRLASGNVRIQIARHNNTTRIKLSPTTDRLRHRLQASKSELKHACAEKGINALIVVETV